jgi:hypothetical protein
VSNIIEPRKQWRRGQLAINPDSTNDDDGRSASRVNERFYEKVIKVKVDVAALLSLFGSVQESDEAHDFSGVHPHR